MNKLKPYRAILETSFILLLALTAVLLVMKVWIAWLVIPLAAWAGVLILRPDLPDVKRAVLFMIGTSLVITLFVELFVLRGDIGRMNTIFKFYHQAWIMLGISAAAAFAWLLVDIPQWLPGWRTAWNTVLIILTACAALFLLIGSMSRIRVRMNPDAPHTLDSMAYMAYAHYSDFGVDMDLSADYRAIRWIEENVPGSPVIVEANCPEYRWCTRYTIYTGLPGVVGWNWHQRQQRGLMAGWVESRVVEVASFYTTSDPAVWQAFLKKYNVRYIIVGQLERAEYPDIEHLGAGLRKFEMFNGIFWKEIYYDGQTIIYEVIGDP